MTAPHCRTEALSFLASKQWLGGQAGAGLSERPAFPVMLNDQERLLLYHLTRSCFLDEGEVVELGAFLGGSTIQLARGLRDRGVRGRVVHSYDRFVADAFLQTRIKEPLPDSRFRHLYDANVAPFANMIEVHDGDILGAEWGGRPIEILFVDIAKTWQINQHLVRSFFPFLIPGVSLVVQQDYLHEWLPWIHVTMEMFSEHFEYVTDTGSNSVVFFYKSEIRTHLLAGFDWSDIRFAEKLALMDRAMARFPDATRGDYLRQAKNVLLGGKPERIPGGRTEG